MYPCQLTNSLPTPTTGALYIRILRAVTIIAAAPTQMEAIVTGRDHTPRLTVVSTATKVICTTTGSHNHAKGTWRFGKGEATITS